MGLRDGGDEVAHGVDFPFGGKHFCEVADAIFALDEFFGGGGLWFAGHGMLSGCDEECSLRSKRI